MKRNLLFACLLLGINLLHAQILLENTSLSSPMPIEAGEEYQLPTMGLSYFSYTPDEDGVVTFTLTPKNPGITLAKIDNQTKENYLIAGVEPNSCRQGVQAGKTYIFQGYYTWGSQVTFTASFTAGQPFIPIEIENITPGEGETYYTTVNEGNIEFTFNQYLDEESVTPYVTLPNGSKEKINDVRYFASQTSNQAFYTVLFADTYTNLMADGKLVPGDKFTISLEGITGNDNPENTYTGSASVTLKASAKAAELVSISKEDGATILSFYMPGNEDGLITFTFDKEIGSYKSAKLMYGDREKDTYNEIEVPVEITGNSLIVNLQNIQMNATTLNGETGLTLTISNIKDVNDELITGNTVGSPGSITVYYLVKTLVTQVYYEFTPRNGSIDQTKEIELWIGGGKYIIFDGIQVTLATTDGEEPQTFFIEKEKLNIMVDEEDDEAILLYFTMSDLIGQEAVTGEATIELVNVLATDGSKPSITATYTLGTSDIHAVPVDDTESPVTVYTLQGVALRTAIYSEVFQGLKQGIYIVNNHKVILK